MEPTNLLAFVQKVLLPAREQASEALALEDLALLNLGDDKSLSFCTVKSAHEELKVVMNKRTAKVKTDKVFS